MRVLIADDHPVSSSGFEFLISQLESFETIGQARDGAEALRLCEELQPDVLILDVMLPRLNGIDVLEKLCELDHRPAVIVISGHTSGLSFQRAIELGAEGVLSKEDDPEELLAALKAISENTSFVSESIRSLTRPLDRTGNSKGDKDALTKREREVLALVADGCTNVEIGAALDIAPGTAKKHRENLYRKLNITKSVEAARLAARLGIAKID